MTEVSAGYRRETPVITKFSASFPARGLIQLRGPNGSGKSTVCELISGYLSPLAGTVLVCGLPASDLSVRPLRRVCRSRVALHPSMSVRDHLTFAALNGGYDLEVLVRRAQDYGLATWMGASARELSTGNARKLWIILCTGGTFDVVVLDEPLNGLDTAGRDLLVREMNRWSRSAAVILVAHDVVEGLEVDGVLEIDSAPARR